MRRQKDNLEKMNVRTFGHKLFANKLIVWVGSGLVGLVLIGGLFVFAAVRNTGAQDSRASVSVNMQQEAAAGLEKDVTLRSISPAENAELNGVQELRAEVQGATASDYDLYWTVNDGPLNPMQDDPANAAQKVASVDVSAWSAQYPHELAYVATDAEGDTELGRLDLAVKVVAPAKTVAAARITNNTIATLPPASGPKAVAGAVLYTDPNNPAAGQAAAWRTSRPNDARLMDKLAAQPTSRWFGGWTSNVQNAVSGYVGAAAAANQVPVLVLYNIPQLNCDPGNGGAVGYDAYTAWVQQVVNGIAGRRALVVLEPDALACVTKPNINQDVRYRSLSKAVDLLKSNANTVVYVDAGHANWVGADDMASRLVKANIAKADGFSLNVSNFIATDPTVNYGNTLSSKLNGRRFVIDTSRNGLGPSGSEWCNPSGRAVGPAPTTNVSHPKVDAYLWIKVPGESDGNWGGCNGGPPPGNWWADYALGLIQRASW